MNKSLLGGLGVVLLALVAGCGSDQDDDKGATLASYAEMVCAVYERCEPEMLARAGGAARCPERYRILLEGTMALPGTAYTDPHWLAGCIAQARSASCSEISKGQLAACELPAGTLGEGSACSDSSQCASVACKKDDFSSACGVCVQRPGLDEPCGSGIPCVAGLHCGVSATSEPICEQAETPDAGDPYTPNEPQIGDACSESYNTCGTKLRCHKGVCALPVQLGGTCSASTDCVSGAFCDPAKDVCAAVKHAAEGEACDVAGVECAEGLWCKGGAVCVAYLADGAACDGWGYAVDGCLFPATCRDSICTLPTAIVCE